VREPLCARHQHGKEIGLLLGRVTPTRLVGTERQALFPGIVARIVNGKNDFINGGIGAAGPAAAVIEDKHVSGAWQPCRNPMCVVLAEEPLIGVGARSVSFGVPPAVEEVAALAALAARMAGRFRLRCAVIDDPEFAEGVYAHDDLVEIGVVRNGIDVGPVRAWPAAWASTGDRRGG